MTARTNDASGMTALQSWDVAIMSAGRSSFRRISPARDVWLPATLISRSAAVAGRASGYQITLAERLRLSCSARRALGAQRHAWPVTGRPGVLAVIGCPFG